ncbi:MAG TPA: hypothetical protein VHP33_10790 [Polyangiaceae bacterium]|nr:hypothetical protein [Polyangiaceae bacterium]
MAANDYSTFSQTPERHDRQDQAASDAFVREFRAAKILCAVGVLAVGTGLTLVLISTPRDEVRVTAGLGQLGLSGRF